MSLVLGIDAGTTGIRAYVYGKGVDFTSFSSHHMPASKVNGNEVEQSPSDWWQCCCDAIDGVLSQSPVSSIAAIAIDGTSSTGLLCGLDGTPIGPALMYNDSRARPQALRISQAVNANPVLASSVASPTSSLSKLLWLLENVPGSNQARHFCHQADWLTGHFLNNYGFSDENNALKLGFDAVQQRWPAEISEFGLPAGLLPEIRPPGSVLGTVCEAMQAQFRLSADCKVIAGTTDSTASCLAAGISKPGDAVTVLGSTLVIKILSEKPVFAPEYGVYSHRLDDLWLVGGASNTGGAVLNQYFDSTQLVELSQHIDPTKDSGFDYYPLLKPGERFPYNDPDYPPRVEPHPPDDVDFLHGLLEGIAKIEAMGYKKLVELGAPEPTCIRSIGGGAMNENWKKIRARQSGVPMIETSSQQTACGTAKLALQSIENK